MSVMCPEKNIGEKHIPETVIDIAKYVPGNILCVMHVLEEAGHIPYLVGGSVRDAVMGIPPHDYDITVSALPEEIRCAFTEKGYKVFDKGGRFGTQGVLVGEELVEITPFRTESGYTDYRHPETVVFVNDIDADLSRRDFTVNAMAMRSDGSIHDVFGGREDLAAGIIRAVGKPEERFSEDALRILRALRFAARFGFDIEEETYAAMAKHKPLMHAVSAERVASELRGILLAPGAEKILSIGLGVLRELFPHLSPYRGFSKTKCDFPLRLFALFKEDGQALAETVAYLKLSCEEETRIKQLSELYRLLPKDKDGHIPFGDETKLALCKYPAEVISDLYGFTGSETGDLSDFIEHGIYNMKKLAIRGGDVVKLKLVPANRTAELMRCLLYDTALGKVKNDYDSLASYASGIKI